MELFFLIFIAEIISNYWITDLSFENKKDSNKMNQNSF